MPDLADVLVDLVTGQLAAFTRLGPLRHLDLDFVRIDEVFARHAEPTRGDLLDRAAAEIAVGIGLEADRVLAPFAGVALSAHPVHRNRDRLVRFSRNRS